MRSDAQSRSPFVVPVTGVKKSVEEAKREPSVSARPPPPTRAPRQPCPSMATLDRRSARGFCSRGTCSQVMSRPAASLCASVHNGTSAGCRSTEQSRGSMARMTRRESPRTRSLVAPSSTAARSPPKSAANSAWLLEAPRTAGPASSSVSTPSPAPAASTAPAPAVDVSEPLPREPPSKLSVSRPSAARPVQRCRATSSVVGARGGGACAGPRVARRDPRPSMASQKLSRAGTPLGARAAPKAESPSQSGTMMMCSSIAEGAEVHQDPCRTS